MIVSLLTYKLAAVYILSRKVRKHLPRFTIKRDLVQVAGGVCGAVKCREYLYLKRVTATQFCTTTL